MNTTNGIRQFLVLLGVGIVVFVATFVLIGSTAGAFFGLVYIVASPLLYEIIDRGPRFIE